MNLERVRNGSDKRRGEREEKMPCFYFNYIQKQQMNK